MIFLKINYLRNQFYDLLSAHFYTLISEIGDVSYQRLMSEAIIKSNELKTSLHHHSLERHDIYKAVLDIETLFLL